MFCFLYKRCFLKLSVIFLYILVYNIFAEEDYEKPYLANNKMYLLTWNSLTVQNISPFYDYFYKYNSLLTSRTKINHIVPKSYELVRVFFNFSFSKTKWESPRYGFFYKINTLENLYTCFNLRQLIRNFILGFGKKVKYEHEFIGIAAFYVGINISYNNNGMMNKNKVNIGGNFGVGLMWSRFYWLLLYNYKNTSEKGIGGINQNEYFSHKLMKKQKTTLVGISKGKKDDTDDILKISNVLKNWENWLNFDIVVDIIPFYIQFKKIFYINIEYKLGLYDTIVSVVKHIKHKDKSTILDHFFYNISINIGIY
jgi:hypothetical protein